MKQRVFYNTLYRLMTIVIISTVRLKTNIQQQQSYLQIVSTLDLDFYILTFNQIETNAPIHLVLYIPLHMFSALVKFNLDNIFLKLPITIILTLVVSSLQTSMLLLHVTKINIAILLHGSKVNITIAGTKCQYYHTVTCITI